MFLSYCYVYQQCVGLIVSYRIGFEAQWMFYLVVVDLTLAILYYYFIYWEYADNYIYCSMGIIYYFVNIMAEWSMILLLTYWVLNKISPLLKESRFDITKAKMRQNSAKLFAQVKYDSWVLIQHFKMHYFESSTLTQIIVQTISVQYYQGPLVV